MALGGRLKFWRYGGVAELRGGSRDGRGGRGGRMEVEELVGGNAGVWLSVCGCSSLEDALWLNRGRS